MTFDDLMAAPLVGANRHALECDEKPDKWATYEMSTWDEVDAFNEMLSCLGIPFQATVDDIMAAAERMERQKEIEYDEWVVATPKNLTSEDLTANHAAGLPVTREHIVRCKDCRWSKEAPKVESYHLECNLRPLSRHYVRDDGFCDHGETR